MPRPAELLGEERDPVHRYGRGEGGCVIGGYVYRGSEHPELAGKYLFGDFNNGIVRSLALDPGGGPPVVEEISELGDRQLTSFGIDAQGELYLLTIGQTFLNGGIIYKLRREGEARPQPPATLSATGAFADLSTLTPRSGLLPYDLAQALWSDGAEKRRWISIPNDGTPDSPEEQIVFSEDGPWQFPVGTVLVKHFEYGGRRLETRFLARGTDGRYFGFTYRWRPDHSDADLLPGPTLEERVELPCGGSLLWHFPSRVECFECHTEASGIVLGPKTRHLHRDLLYPTTGRTANQIETWSELGFFENPPDPAGLGGLLAAANLLDEDESLDRRARSYLDINCSHCHLPGGPVQTRFDLRLTTPPNYQNLVNADPDNPLGFTDPKLVKPGDPDLSILLFRLGSLDSCCAMPPIAKNAADAEAVRVLAEWIGSLDPATSPAGREEGPAPWDPDPPRLSLSLPGGPEVAGRFEVQITASEPVFGLAASDFVVRNGRVLSLAGSGTAYTLAILPRSGGVGTVSLPSDRLVDAKGNANLPQDDLLAFDFVAPSAANLLANGGFESGLESWISVGEASETPLAQSGALAARLGAGAALAQSFAVEGETNYLLGGWSRAGGGADGARAILAFWNAEGRWLREKAVAPPVFAAYDSFREPVTAPAGAVLATLYLLAPESGDVLLDELSFAAGGQGEPPSGPLTDNGDFERGLLFWETENEVAASPAAQLGAGAARIGPGSSASFVRSVLPGTRLVMTGAYFTEDDPAQAEAALLFWSAAGDFLGERATPLPPAAAYRDFFFFADVPEGAERLAIRIRNGGSGAVTVDDLGLVYVPHEAPAAPASSETGFEDGASGPWHTMGPVGFDAPPLSGLAAARLGPVASMETGRWAAPGIRYLLAGHYRASGGVSVHEIGIVFRDRYGAVVGERSAALPASPSYAPFEIAALAPAGTVSLSLWIYKGEEGGLELDDLVFAEIGTGAAPETGAHSSVPVLLGSRLTRTFLETRDPRAFSDPLDNLGRPDLAVRGPRRGLIGTGVHDPSGRSQTSVVPMRLRSARAVFRIQWRNDAAKRRDAAVLRGTRGNTRHRLAYFEKVPTPGNRTALVFAGRCLTPEAAPGDSALYEAIVRPARPWLRQRFRAMLEARSVLSPDVRDTIRMGLR